MNQRTRRFEALAALVLPLVFLPRPAAAVSVVLNVNTDADIADGTPGDGVCRTAPGGPCTLRAAFMEAWRGKKLGGVIVTVSAAPGNTSARLESFVIGGAPYASGGYADIDELFRQQAQERDRKKRETILHQIQRLMYERVMFGGIFEPATLHGVGSRVEEAAIGLNPQLYFAAPYEDMRDRKSVV